MYKLKYKIPAIKTYSMAEVVEIIGPTQTASFNAEGWRGTKLEQPENYEYRLAENNYGTNLIQLDSKGGIKNA